MDSTIISVDFTRKRKCLTAYVDSGKPNNSGEDFGARLQRIKMSLERINRLMAELKQISQAEAQHE